jgi:membrane-associated phospholipid phosphatase
MSRIHCLRTCCIAALLVLAAASSAFAAENTPLAAESASSPDGGAASVELNRDYFKGYVTDTESILTAPARWDGSSWLKASLITVVAAGLYTQDDKIHTWVQDRKNATTSHLADDAKDLYLLSFPALAGLGAYGYLAPDTKAKTTFLLSAESFVITGVFVQVLKHTTGRHRPYTGDAHDTWSSGYTSVGAYQSFPSGDASTAFSLATVVASEYDNMIVPPLAYGTAALIALERVHNNAHWPSDVFVASVIGYFTGKTVVASHAENSSLSFEPFLDGPDVGVLVSCRF